MTVQVLLFGPLRDAAGWAERSVEGSRVDEVWASLCRRWPALEAHRGGVRPAVNLRYADWRDDLDDGCTVAFIPPVAGGATASATVEARLTREQIDVAALLERARGEANGAVDLFLGTVRDRNEGQPVSLLVYSAYEPMALALMEELTARTAAEHGVSRLLAVHRLGALTVGEVAIAVVAAAAHRAEAFAACRALVDAIKADVPIFKREHRGDGIHWTDAGCAGAEAG